MKRTSVVLLSIVLAPALYADAGQHILPAGSLIGCTVSEPHVSSKTMAPGDPVLCQVSSSRYGHMLLPYHSYLVGRFEDFKDPGHFVGKGWMELRFDRMVIEPDTVIPLDARVVDVPGYKVDNQGRIQGKGHATRDIVTWSIPILWPIDLLMLPMRGPRPTLKEETRLTLKVMDDLPVPQTTTPQADPYGLMHRQPSAEATPPPAPTPEAPPETNAYAPTDQAPAPVQAQPQYSYAPPPPPPPVYAYAAPVIVPAAVAYSPVVVMPAPVYAYAPVATVVVPARPYAYAYAPPPPPAYGYGGTARSYGYPGPQRPAQSYGYSNSGYGMNSGAPYYGTR
ncbi:hypothetical protein DYQ86_09235 [Acidobacteria bacterium AB60]|nr:hypothetical protein DYQ86_09235 [Acidobacteria bacterium AB60]